MQFGDRQHRPVLRSLSLALSTTFLWGTTAPALAGSGTKARGNTRPLTRLELRQIRGTQMGFGQPGGMPPTAVAREDDAGSTFPWEAGTGGVNTANRNKLTTIPLVSWSARGGMAVSMDLYHNSKANRQTELGFHWTHSYDIYASVETTTGDVLVQWGDNLNYTFTKNIDGSYSAPTGIFETLTYNATTDKYTLTKKDQTVVTFSKGQGIRYNGSSIADRNGNTLTINHNSSDYVTSVVDPTGRTLSFAYGVGNHLTSITDPAGRVFSFAFNGQNNLVSVTYPTAGGQTPSVSFGYNAQHSITSLTDARGKVWTFGYDGTGKGLSWEKNPLNQETNYTGNELGSTVTDPLGNATSYNYDFSGRLASVMLPGWSTVSYGYGANNLRTSITDANWNTTSFTYDAKGNVLTKTNALWNTWTFTYNAKNDVLTSTTPGGQVATRTYNTAGNLISVANPMGHTTSFTVNANGLVTAITDATSRTTTFDYDSHGNQTTVTNGLSQATTTAYNILGMPTSQTDATGKVTSTAYDNLGRVTSITAPGSRTTSFTYDLGGNKLTQTNPLGQVNSYTYDDAGRVLTHTDGLGRTVSFGYNANGQKTSFTDARGKVTSYAYNSRGLLSQISYPDGTTQSYTYNANGELQTKTDGRGVSATHSYDPDGQLTSIDYSDATPSVSFTYEADGCRATMTDGTGTTTYTRDSADRLTSRATPQGSITYSYDNAGRVTLKVGGGSTVAYSYDAAGRMTSMQVNGTQTTSYTYDAAGRVTSTAKPDGSVETRSYTTAADLASIAAAKSGSTITSSVYTYDNLGRKLTETTPTYAVGYTYDNAGQLTGEVRTGANPYSIGYTYDNAGNRASKTLGGTTESYTYDDANKLLTAGGKSYTYDAAGNVTGVNWSGGSTSLAWDAESRLKSATSGGSTTDYSYNGIGQRVAKSGAITAAYLLSDDSIASEVLADGNSSYVHGVSGLVSENRGGTSKFYHEDGLGSVRTLTNSNGTITDTRSTDAFGTLVASSGSTPTPFGFAGAHGYQQDSETGLARLGHRMYDASTGRFLSRDPIRDGYNWYAYCENDPINAIDPEGLSDLLNESFTTPRCSHGRMQGLCADCPVSRCEHGHSLGSTSCLSCYPVTMYPKKEEKERKLPVKVEEEDDSFKVKKEYPFEMRNLGRGQIGFGGGVKNDPKEKPNGPPRKKTDAFVILNLEFRV